MEELKIKCTSTQIKCEDQFYPHEKIHLAKKYPGYCWCQGDQSTIDNCEFAIPIYD